MPGPYLIPKQGPRCLCDSSYSNQIHDCLDVNLVGLPRLGSVVLDLLSSRPPEQVVLHQHNKRSSHRLPRKLGQPHQSTDLQSTTVKQRMGDLLQTTAGERGRREDGRGQLARKAADPVSSELVWTHPDERAKVVLDDVVR